MTPSPVSSPLDKPLTIPILRVPFDAEDKKFLTEGLLEILASGGLTMGKHTKAFEEESARAFGVPYAVATSNCTTALEIILRAVGVEGGTVVVPTNTFIATAFAAVHAGARVVFADCDPKTLCLSARDVERRLRPDTKAVVLVHIGGIITPDIEQIKALCDKKGVVLVEDCAHAHGSSYKGVKAGAWGLAGAFSYFPTKPLVSGEGGLITTKDQGLYEKALMLRNHGKNPKLGNRITELGHNWRMSELTALLALQQTRKAEKLFADRKREAAFYDKALAGAPGIEFLPIPAGLDTTYYKYVLFLRPGLDRAALKTMLKEEYKVSLTGEVYDMPAHKEPVWGIHPGAALNCGEAFPGAEEVAARHICLPLYPGLSDAELGHVAASLKDALRRLGA